MFAVASMNLVCSTLVLLRIRGVIIDKEYLTDIYKLSKKWFLSIYGKQNLDTRRYRGLSSEAIPTTLGSDIVLKVGKGWKLKTGVQYQYNTIQKRWEWVPQICISYEW